MRAFFTGVFGAAAIVATIGFSGGLVSCTGGPKADKIAGPRISVMTYNVENLFDTNHDKDTEDYTFLPLATKQSNRDIRKGCLGGSSDYRVKECLETDWNDEVLKKKLSRVGAVIKQVGDGRGPDILIMAEVENENVLRQLRDQQLADSGYVTLKLIDGFDPRGIDPAIMSRFPMWREPKLHRIPMKAEDAKGEWGATKTRGILEVPLTLPDGTKALVYALHFPSQQNPVYLRAQAVNFLNELLKDVPADVVAIVGGDFNITRSEDDERGFFKTTLNNKWAVSHVEGCKKCDGTHYYHPKTDWSFLDAILVSRTSTAQTGWKIDPESVRVPADSKYQVNRFGSPARFDENATTGVSDHWPVYVELVKPAPKATTVQ